MKSPQSMHWLAVALAGVAAIFLGAAGLAQAQATTQEETQGMTRHARGPFTVTMSPQGDGASIDGVTTGRMSLDKVFSGDLDAVGTGEMLTARTSVAGSAGYVAIERVTGKLDGRAGSFVLQHSGTMGGGAQRLSISVVPDSGTGQLTGIAGVLTIDIAPGGAHSYHFAYTLPAQD